MITNILFSILLSASVTGTNVHNVTLNMTFKATIVNNEELDIDYFSVAGCSGVYRVVASIRNDRGVFKESFLVFDAIGILSSDNILMIAVNNNNDIKLTTPSPLVFASVWDNKLTEQQVVAYFKNKKLLELVNK